MRYIVRRGGGRRWWCFNCSDMGDRSAQFDYIYELLDHPNDEPDNKQWLCEKCCPEQLKIQALLSDLP